MNTDAWNPMFGADAMMKAWSELAVSMAKNGLSAPPVASPPEAANQMRSAMLTAWGDYCAQFMRSAEFQEMIRQSLSAAVEARKQWNDVLGQMQHDLQGASRQDVDYLVRSLRQGDRRIADGLEQISAQLEELNNRIDKLERQLKREKREKREKHGAARDVAP